MARFKSGDVVWVRAEGSLEAKRGSVVGECGGRWLVRLDSGAIDNVYEGDLCLNGLHEYSFRYGAFDPADFERIAGVAVERLADRFVVRSKHCLDDLVS